MQFELTAVETEKFKNWDKKHKNCKLNSGTIGGRLTFSFTPNGIGCITTVKCGICGKVLDLTDVSSW